MFATESHISIANRLRIFFIIACSVADYSYAGACKVLDFAAPDAVRLQEEARQRAELPRKKRELKVWNEQEDARRKAEIVQRELESRKRFGGTTDTRWTETATVLDGDKSYQVQVVPGTDPGFAQSAFEEGKRIERIPETPIVKAIDSGDLKTLRKLIAQGVDVRTVKDKIGRGGLVARAIRKWYAETVSSSQPAPKLQAALDRRDKVADAYVNIVKTLVAAGADPSEPYSNAIPLWIIASNAQGERNPPGVLELTRYLLEHGASLVLPEKHRRSSLDHAIERGNQKLVEAILRHGKLDQHLKNSALVTAMESKNWKLAIQLLEAGANPNITPSAYGKCCGDPLLDKIAFRDPRSRDLLKAMIAHKVDPNPEQTDSYKLTPLMRTLHDYELMKAFLDIGADPNAQDRDGNTALHLATRLITSQPNSDLDLSGDLRRMHYTQITEPESRTRSVELLLRYGAKPDVQNKRGMTPLMLASMGDAKIIALLLNAGAQTINTAAGRGRFYQQYDIPIGPVVWALLEGNETLAVQWLQKNPKLQDSDCGAVYYAARGGAITALSALLDKNAPLSVEENSGETPLIGAARAGHVSTVMLLLDRRAADINESTKPPLIMPGKGMGMSAQEAMVAGMRAELGGITPLMAAIKSERMDVVKLLVERGADLNRRDKLGRPALDYAASARNSEMLALLKTAGAAPHELSPEEIKEQQVYSARVAQEIQKSLGAGNKEFRLSPEVGKNPVLPGDDSSVEMIDCEKRSDFTVYGYANEQAHIAVSACRKNAQRVRNLAIHADQVLGATLKSIGQPGLTEAQARKAGWYSAHERLDDGSDFYFFPVISVGHGILITHTAVLFDGQSAQSVVIQFSAYPMCERKEYLDSIACQNIEKALRDLAVAVAH